MKEPQAERQELEDWLDGSLAEARRRAFESRLGTDLDLAREAELAQRIEDVLRRRFALPAADAPEVRPFVGRGAPAGVPPGQGAGYAAARRSRAPGQPAPRTAWRLLGLAATAAAALLVLRLFDEPAQAPTPLDESRLASSAAAPSAALVQRIPGRAEAGEADSGPRVGPLVDSRAGIPLARVEHPDLETLYSEATALAADRSLSVCGSGGELAGVLETSYGQKVTLRAEAEGQLQGPFASSEWPTGVILAAYSEEAPAVLVAERDSTHECCLALQLPADSHLKMFTWRVGDLVLTEITPLAEPRLLDSFDEVF